ncbi:MAG: 16S rRNA (cytosine(1402)-N(4))-methyltransferase, partial [bacterium]
MAFSHKSVLLEECLEALQIKEDGIYVDATLGAGGHSARILERLKGGHLYCFDQDHDAVIAANERLSAISDAYTIIETNFKYLKRELNQRGVNQVDGILFDLGVSSPQFDTPERGFSYNYDGRLDMRRLREGLGSCARSEGGDRKRALR